MCFSIFTQGKKNPGTDRTSVELFLDQVFKAKEMKIDKYVHIYICLSTVESIYKLLVNN